MGRHSPRRCAGSGIATIREIRHNRVDVRATGRLNKHYTELLRENPDWSQDARSADMNHRLFPGSGEFIRGKERRCIGIGDDDLASATRNDWAARRANT